VPGHIPLGGHGTGHRGERNGGAQAGRRVLRAHHRVRRAPGVRVFRVVHFRLHTAVRPADRRDRRAGCHITQASEQVSLRTYNYVLLLLVILIYCIIIII